MMLHAFYAIACALLWSGTTVAGKMLPASIPSLTFAFIRYLIATMCMWPFIQRAEYKNITRRLIPDIMFLGLTVTLIYNIFFFNAVHLTAATSVSLISATNPILTLLFSSMIFGRVPTKYQLVAFMLSFAGVAMVITQGKTGLEVFTASLGELLALASVITYVAYTLTLKKVSVHFSPLFLSFVTGVCGLLFMLPFVANYETLEVVLSFGLYEWSLFAYLGFIGTAMGMLLYSQSVKRGGAELTTLIVFSTMPIFVGILSFFLLGDQFSFWQLSGGVLVLAALIIGIKKAGP